MERLRNMGLKRSFVVLAALCLLAALALTAAVYIACGWIASDYPGAASRLGRMEPSRSWRSPQWSRLVFCVC